MRRLIHPAVAAVALLLTAWAPCAQRPRFIALTGATIVDGNGGAPLPDGVTTVCARGVSR